MYTLESHHLSRDDEPIVSPEGLLCPVVTVPSALLPCPAFPSPHPGSCLAPSRCHPRACVLEVCVNAVTRSTPFLAWLLSSSLTILRASPCQCVLAAWPRRTRQSLWMSVTQLAHRSHGDGDLGGSWLLAAARSPKAAHHRSCAHCGSPAELPGPEAPSCGGCVCV